MKGQFQLFYQLIGDNGLLYSTTDIIDTYVYRALTVNFDIGMGSAAGVFQSVFGFVLVITVNAIVRKLNPECGFVLLDKLEQMDLRTLTDFGSWLASEGLQAIATRVSTGGECQIIIEDGRVQGADITPAPQPRQWTKGAF